ncbi:hypothetical protein [Streptomyces sp. 147326]|uniref:hypothetical protein n=1 Tax=Streptomyces sp. 147326 TaxID=3074379 RepID=UPI0038578674
MSRSAPGPTRRPASTRSPTIRAVTAGATPQADPRGRRQPSRLVHRPRTHRLLKGARRSFSWKDRRDLLVRAHIQLGGPVVVVWDHLNTHLAPGLKRYEAGHDRLTTAAGRRMHQT